MSNSESAKSDAVPAGLNLANAAEFDQNVRHLDRLATLGRLTASLAHEIKNSLVASKTFIDLLLEKDQNSELAEVVRRELSRIEAMVSQMASFAGPSRQVLAPVRLHEVLDHSLRLVRPQLEAKFNSLRRAYAAPSDIIRGNEYELEQAFVNLMLNASEAMGDRGTLTVETELISASSMIGNHHAPIGPQQLHVTIRDTGIGIPAEHIDRLFEPFFTTKEGGTGLGLAITRRIIQEHGGSIGVVSQPNHGATFQIVLPAVT